MSKNNDNLVIQILIFQTILTFIRSFIYITFDEQYFDLDKKLFKKDISPKVDRVLLLFSIIRISVTIFIFSLRGIRNDVLTYVLLCFAISASIRFYYEYLILFEPKSKNIEYIDKFQDLNAMILFLLSVYILKYIFF